MDDRTRARLRALLATSVRSGPGMGHPRALRLEVARYALTRCSGGATVAQVAHELSLNQQTLRRWMTLHEQSPFCVVRVVDDTPTSPTSFSVVGPCGVRVEGLSLDSLAALLRKLAT